MNPQTQIKIIFERNVTTNATTAICSDSRTANKIVDLRSDTVTQPSKEMLETVLNAPTGDDVLSEDPTVKKLEEYASELFKKEKALFVPTVR